METMTNDKSMLENKKGEEHLALDHTISHRRGSVHDAVFGDVTEGGPNYRDVSVVIWQCLRRILAYSLLTAAQVGWMGTAFLMMKTQIGLGVLSIPLAFDTLGLIPGVICMLTIAVITTWSDYMVGIFKLNHPDVYGIDDIGRLAAGRIGYIVMGGAFCLCKSQLHPNVARR